MNRMRKITILGGTSLIVLIAAFVLLSQLGGAKVLPILASEDDAEFDQAMEKVRVVVEDPEATVDWVSVYRAILRLKELDDPRCAPLLARLLARERALQIVEGSPLPGVMPPLEMLKSAAIEALVAVEAKEHLPAIQSVYGQTRFMVLRDAAGNAIGALGGTTAE
jgi:HEAT repeat protein